MCSEQLDAFQLNFGKMQFTIYEIIKNRRFSLSLETTFLEKPQQSGNPPYSQRFQGYTQKKVCQDILVKEKII